MLIVLLIIPIITIFTIWFLCNPAPLGKSRDVIFVALGGSILNLIQTLIIMTWFDPNSSQFQFQFFGKLGIDGISLWLVWLVNMLMPIIILSTWKAIPVPTSFTNMNKESEHNKGILKEDLHHIDYVMNTKQFIILLLLIGFWSIAVFIVLDLLLFYISFEGVLIPMYYLVTFYGSRNRKMHASYQFFIYTLFGSLFLFLALLILYLETGTTDYQILLTVPISIDKQFILWLAFFICFAVKLPAIPFHIWLITTHVEAPTAGSVLLAAILLKLGSYGLIRYSIPLFPVASEYFTPLVMVLCIMGVIYTSIAALVQIDMKLIIAYSSIAHQGTATLGLFSNDILGIQSSIYFTISHGLISSGLFLLVGVLYERYHTRTITYYRGLAQVYPIFVTLFLVFSLSNAAVPLSSGFIAEFLALLGVFHYNTFIAILGGLSVILVPAFMLNLLHRISYGSFTPYLPVVTSDITRKEFHIFLPLVFFIILFGVYPQLILDLLLYPSLTMLHL